MKVLHILPTLERRGAQVFARDLMEQLNSHQGFEQILTVLSPGSDEVDVSRVCKTVNLLSASVASLRLAQLKTILRKSNPDIIYAHGGRPLKYAVLAHGLYHNYKIVYRKIGLTEQWLGYNRWLKLPFQRWLLKKADAVVAVGYEMAREAIELFHADPAKIKVIYQGIDPQAFNEPEGTRERVRTSLGLSTDHKILITVGALSWEKNQATMLRVLAELRQNCPDVVLLLIGDGPERSLLERLAAELCIIDSVYFLGVRQDVPELLIAADVCLLSSLTEGVPGVLIEAGMAGLSCVTWDVAGAKEVVQDGVTGLITLYNDETAFAAAVFQLINDRDLRSKMGTAAQDFCCKKFSINRCVSEHLELFENVLIDNE